ncbi:hypothetical protein [Curtobacterium sp. 20TX0008]|uniref:hypothetical protein n=1 Tax=Curtobacterium sp. 20TX0008 TaxID=3022018 RepID=UPI002330B162|nr:hypothetical protein [Curtobacterium sp. 20TX0008]MDB6425956.1 hypothetical protein [Curtobacterium sp. 20TX0008]
MSSVGAPPAGEAATSDGAQWLLLTGQDLDRVVRIGRKPVGPVSLRRQSSMPARLALMPALERVVKQDLRRVVHETALVQGQRWQVIVHPIRTPFTDTLIAAHAIVAPEHQRLHPPEPAGCWEWLIERAPDGSPSTRRKSYWNRDLFDVYRVDAAQPARSLGAWDVSDWQNELVYEGDRARIAQAVRDALDGAMGQLSSLTFRIWSGLGSPDRALTNVRIVAKLGTPLPDGTLIISGITYRVPEQFNERTLPLATSDIDDIIRGLQTLDPSPTALVHPETLEVFLSSPPWTLLFGRGATSLTDAISADGSHLHDFLLACAQDTVAREYDDTVSAAPQEGDMLQARLTACGVESRRGVALRDVLIRITPLPE